MSSPSDLSDVEMESDVASTGVSSDSHCGRRQSAPQTRIKLYQPTEEISALPSRLNSAALIGWAFLVGLFLAGCGGNAAGRESSNGKNVPRSAAAKGAISEINMMTGPVAINMDREPDLDGISVRLFFTDPTQPKAVAISSGSVDVLMFDGLFVPGKDAPPLRKEWTFTAAQLESLRYQSALGEAYELLLAWGEDRPDSRAVSVVARYRSLDDSYLLSGSSSISVMDAFRQPPAYR